MPAWGLAGGGALPEQPVEDLVNFLKSIQITPEEAKKRNTERAQKIMQDNPGISEGSGAVHDRLRPVPHQGLVLRRPAGHGRGRCLRPEPDRRRDAAAVPAAGRRIRKHMEFVTTGSEFQKTYGTQGIGSGRMPGFGDMLTARQIDEIVIYERGL